MIDLVCLKKCATVHLRKPSTTLTTPRRCLSSKFVNSANKSILFFDGDCGLCNQTVRFLIKRDRHKRLYFAPLQGATAQAIVPSEYRKLLSTVVYNRAHEDKKHSLHIRSNAALLALIDIGGFWRIVAKCMHLFPVRFRDGCYDRIASNRSRLFGKETCKLPTKAEQARILP